MAALEKMPGHPRLYRRGTTYYHRAAIPKDIADSYPKSEETFSLKTKDHAEAVKKVRIAAVEVDQRFEEHRRRLKRSAAAPLDELTPDQIRLVHDTYYRHLMEEDEEVRLSGFVDLEGERLKEDISKQHPEITVLQRDNYEDAAEWNDRLIEHTRERYRRGLPSSFDRDEAEEVLSWEGINIRLKQNSPSWPRVTRAIQEASIRAGEAIQKRYAGEIVETPKAEVTTHPSTDTSPLLSEIFESRKAVADRTGEWSPKLVDDYVTWTSLFIEVVGDKPILSYRKPDAREFRDLLLDLPSNRHKVNATRGLTAREAVKAAKRLELKRITVSTVNKALSRLQATWNWADGQLDEVVTDIFGPMKLAEDVRAIDQRHPFDTEQLNRIFNGPLYIGCKSERRRTEPGETDMAHTHWYWLPLLGLFTGARLNELCQLMIDDLGEDSGIHFLRLHEGEETQRIKGHNRRVVPIHPELIRLGFVRYVEKAKSAGETQVFPTLRPSSKGYYSHQPSKDFNAYIEKIAAKTDRTSFHSFRHNFKDACRNCEVAHDIADLLQGHTLQGMAGRYGSGQVLLRRLHSEMSKVEYPELDLSHLAGFGKR